MSSVNRRTLPGFQLSLGYAVFYLSALVLIPLAACFLKAASLSWEGFWAAVWSERARAAYTLTFGASLVAAGVNAVLGLLVAWVLVRYDFPLKRLFDALVDLLVAWVLVRYDFPLKRLFDALVDLPFALPTAVAGLVFASLYASNGWLGQWLVPLGIQGAYSRLGIVLVLVFTGFPFVVRTVQPILQSLEADVEEAAATLGATRAQTFRHVLLPLLLPAVLTGFALAFARALGEYGSVVFVSGNMPFKTEIAPVLIVGRLEEFAYNEATAIAVVLLTMSFVLLALINLLERWSKSYVA
jgi:sulfate transport system permease protein